MLGCNMPPMLLLLGSSSLLLDGQNVCLKAAQDCGLYEKCGSLRSEYVLACTKHAPGSDHCNRQKCHRALRRFLERVPEEYSLGLLFCPCTDKLCGERRRKTIVPSCSYQGKDWIQPSCLLLQSFCRRDQLCRSDKHYIPLAIPLPAVSERVEPCTIMTPNYVSNSTVDVDLWCNCEGSGNQWQDCLRIQHMFTNNACLGYTFPPPSRPSPLDQQNELSDNAQDELSNNAVSTTTPHYPILPNITQHYPILPIITQHYPILPNITQHYPIIPNITQHYPILPNMTQHYPILPNII
uniref:GDNF family receptor alpha 3 n=1 Tax=Hucho hucho TaxID=62062 RepID=A0A4W5NDP0_9TELE